MNSKNNSVHVLFFESSSAVLLSALLVEFVKIMQLAHPMRT